MATVATYAMGKDEFLEMDVSETIDQAEQGYWFDFEPALVAKDSSDTNVLSEGDLSTNDGLIATRFSHEARGPCRFFQAGHCQKGRNCPYRHQRPDRAVVCKHWLRALCKKGDQCEFLHVYDLSKMPECYFYTKFGECTNPECLYRHLLQDEKSSECPWYAKGFCKHGERCRHKHVHKILCDNYYLGFCPDGPNCKFGHPKWDAPAIYLGQQTQDEQNALHSQIKQQAQALGIQPSQPMPKPVNQNLICHLCQQPGHKAAFCPTKPPEFNASGERRSLDQVTCFKCGQRGHYANHCTLPFGVGGPTAAQALQQPGQFQAGGQQFQGGQQQQFRQQPNQQQQQQYQQYQAIPTMPQW